MSYKAATYRRTGNDKMAKNIKALAKSCDLTVNSFNADGWVLKNISITVYGHVDDIARFETQLPAGVQN